MHPCNRWLTISVFDSLTLRHILRYPIIFTLLNRSQFTCKQIHIFLTTEYMSCTWFEEDVCARLTPDRRGLLVSQYALRAPVASGWCRTAWCSGDVTRWWGRRGHLLTARGARPGRRAALFAQCAERIRIDVAPCCRQLARRRCSTFSVRHCTAATSTTSVKL